MDVEAELEIREWEIISCGRSKQNSVALKADSCKAVQTQLADTC